MKLEQSLYPALLAGTVATQGLAMGVIPSDNTPEKIKNFQKKVQQNPVSFAIVTTALPLVIDAALTGKPLSAFCTAVLMGTGAADFFKDSHKDNKIIKFVDTHGSIIDALSSGVPLARDLMTKNPPLLDYLPSAMFVTTSVGSQMVKRKAITNPNVPKALSANFMVACMLLAHNLFKAGKTPQALLALNLSMMVGKKLHDDYKKSK